MDTKEAFRAVAGSNINNEPTPPIFYNRVHNLLLSTPIGCGILTSVVLFLFLLFLNPPIVQNKQKENELSKPSPNLLTILIISILSGLGVLILEKYWIN